MKIVIGGAGIAGLALGWRLAQAGCSVDIVERGIAARGATWASAGMLAPGAELGCETGALAQFARDGREAWPAFAGELERASGFDVALHECGTLIVAETEEAAARLRARADGNAQWLSPREAAAKESLLSPAIHGALAVPEDAHVDNRAVGEALVVAATRAGARLHENVAIRSLAVVDNRVRGVIAAERAFEADAVILALGAWMNLIGGADAVPQVTPTKGQMAALEPPAGAAMPQSLVWSDEVYIVPREKRLLLGATVEDAGFDLSVSGEARDRLVSAAIRIMPSLREWRVAEAWAGLRPRTADDAPLLGATARPGLYVAGGQFRNGILFAPLVADRMAAMVLGRKQPDPAFDPKRFPRET